MEGRPQGGRSANGCHSNPADDVGMKVTSPTSSTQDSTA